MFAFLRHFLPSLLAILMMGEILSAQAGWMGFRNDTTKTIILQELVPTGSGSKPGLSQKIFANETVRDSSNRSGQKRTFTIFDASKSDKAIYTGQFSIPGENENILFILKSDGRGGIVVEIVRHTVSAKPKR
ncbi:MAG: hypothetical protein EXS09_12655 [Gemmataceae bacterium]|nr:hypothetical protein [Gemmataceae bacterium]